RNENYILRLDQNGLLTRIAGGPRQGFSGDGGPAIDALFDDILGLAVDGSASVYVTDSTNSRVRKVSPSGIIATVAGNGTLFRSQSSTDERAAGDLQPAANKQDCLHRALSNLLRKVSAMDRPGMYSTGGGST